ncbi:MAG: hypothetical protein RL607_144 [Bacteroidota bacterium]
MFPIKSMVLNNHNRTGRKLSEAKAIVLHCTANEREGADALALHHYYSEKQYDGRQLVYASPHFLVDDHQIIQCLPEDEAGFHVGTAFYNYTPLARILMGKQKSANNVTIGIEMCVNRDGNFDRTLEQAALLTRHLANKYCIDRNHILRHYDISRKECPKMLLDPMSWNKFLDFIFQPEPSIHPSKLA